MVTKSIKAILALAILGGAPAPAVASDLGAAIVGGIIGGALMNEAGKQKRTKRYYSSNSAQRQANRETQRSLNYFGFDAGGADGIMGSRSRAAISRYQAFMGWPATGRLQPLERDLLVSSHNRAQLGGPQVVKAMQRDPQGVRSLLLTWRDERMGITGRRSGTGYAGLPIEVSDGVDEIADSSEPSAEQLLQRSGFIQIADLNGDGRNDYLIDTAVTGSSFWCGQTQCTALVFASQPDGYRRNDFQYRRNAQLSNTAQTAMFQCHQASCTMDDPLGGGVQTAGALHEPPPSVEAQSEPPVKSASAQTGGGAGALKPLVPSTQAAKQPSLASYCSKVSLLTSSNGGFVTEASMTDPELALSEQFCLTRTYAIAQGEEMVESVQGLTEAQIESQCDAFGPALAPYVKMLATDGAAKVVPQVQKFVLGVDMTVEQLQSTGAICLYTGYRRDKLDVALGAALLMVGTGKAPYAELVGHHVGQGFGTQASADRARGWYAHALDAMDGGAAPVFMPGQADRVDLLRAALGGAGASAAPTPKTTSLPSFSTE